MYSQFNFSNGFNQQPSGFGQQQRVPAATTIGIDDIIGALQNARDAKIKAEQIAEKAQQKPLDFNRSTTYWTVCNRLFANGHVWQQESVMWPDEQSANFEKRRLSVQNPHADYRVFKVNWVVDGNEEKEEPPVSSRKGNFETHQVGAPPVREGAFRFSDDEDDCA
jgi:hypothetical protein